ncbi:hypothetical protein Gorai_023113 [Gossypium raimondii]|uniref:Endonuclease/exonuclease/phosphatase domain-containing protein n=1 Tax=Gossypium raimondii TaxID=29730 RepID=A0A7J8NVR5_GOSRA|nr:hypothetical protein [Gossypium raimondii]
MYRVLKSLWFTKEEVNFVALNERLILVKFGNIDDRTRILNLTLWLFDQCLFAMLPFVAIDVREAIGEVVAIDWRDRKEDVRLFGYEFRRSTWWFGVDVTIQNYSSHHSDSLVKMKGQNNFWFTWFYGHADPNLRNHSWDILRIVGRSVREDWIIGGDFNAIINDAEKARGRRKSRVLMDEFTDLVAQIDKLIDGPYMDFTSDMLKISHIKLGHLYAKEESYWA